MQGSFYSSPLIHNIDFYQRIQRLRNGLRSPSEGTQDEFHIRWYTPSFTEIALCGHATLASAFILFTKYYSSGDVPETIILHTRESGLLRTKLLQPTATHPLLIQMNVSEKPLPNLYALDRNSSSVAKALDCLVSEVVYSGECTSYFGMWRLVGLLIFRI